MSAKQSTGGGPFTFSQRQRLQRPIFRRREGSGEAAGRDVIDGEVIAPDDDGHPAFNILQNRGSSKAPVLYFVFDVMVLPVET